LGKLSDIVPMPHRRGAAHIYPPRNPIAAAADGPRLILFRLPSPRRLHRQVPPTASQATAICNPVAAECSNRALTELSSPEPKKRLLTLLGRRMVTNKMRSNVAPEPSVHQRRITEYEAVGSIVIEKDRPVGQNAAEAEVPIIQRPSAKKRERGK